MLDLPRVEPEEVPMVDEEPAIEADTALEPTEIEDLEAAQDSPIAPEPIVEPPPVTLDDVESELQRQSTEEGLREEISELDPIESPRSDSALLVESTEPDSFVEEEKEAQEIQLTELLESPLEMETATSDESETVESLGPVDLDAGLSWLPDETEEKGRKELWVILLLILVGALLGVLFYFFVLRPGSDQSAVPLESDAIATPALAAALPRTVPAPQVPRAEPEPPAPVPPLTALDRITWERLGEETVITLWADGSFVDGQVEDFRVDGASPRQVIRIRGIRRPFGETRIELGTAHVRRIRTGLHRDDDGSSLHIVADLVDAGVRLLRTETSGQQLRVHFSNADS